MPEDAARIEHSWDTAAARWRFEAHRRNMLLRALAASGADSDLLGQLSSTLSNLDMHAQDLLHSAVHRTQLTTARDTHRASALAVALRKLNASYARRTRDLDKARSQIAALRGDVDEAWKVAVEQAAELGKLKAVAPDLHEKITTSLDDSVIDDGHPDEDDAIQDGASIDLTMISRAELVDVTGKAVAAQARLTLMRTEHSSSSSAPPSALSSPHHSSPMTPGTNTPLDRQSSIASQVSRATAPESAVAAGVRRARVSLHPLASAPTRPRGKNLVRAGRGPRATARRARNLCWPDIPFHDSQLICKDPFWRWKAVQLATRVV
ncbi:hypothetical protein BGW80DRAFT_523558 [Lactifluus volemus]|nr:hypothetical protein BGW80DRAFT_523558 [Lactifluus volemus]